MPYRFTFGCLKVSELISLYFGCPHSYLCYTLGVQGGGGPQEMGAGGAAMHTVAQRQFADLLLRLRLQYRLLFKLRMNTRRKQHLSSKWWTPDWDTWSPCVMVQGSYMGTDVGRRRRRHSESQVDIQAKKLGLEFLRSLWTVSKHGPQDYTQNIDRNSVSIMVWPGETFKEKLPQRDPN